MKSVLVVDTPKDCYDCPCYDHEGGICQESHNWKTDRENGCPLKPLPQKKETRKAMQYRGLAEEYRKEGWNECLDAITGETE